MAKTFKLSINCDYIRFLIKQNRRFIILMTVIMLVFNPILVLMLGTLMDISLGLIYTGKVLNILLALVFSFVVSSIMFSYLNDRSSVDLYHSLPINRSSLHLSVFLASLVVLLIPFTISWFTAIPLQLFLVDPQILATISGYFYVIIPLVAVVTIITYVQVNTGTAFDAMLYAFIVIMLPFFAYLTYFAYGNAILIGFNAAFNWKFLSYLSPFVAIFNNTINNEFITNYLFLNQVYWLIVIALIYIITLKIYQSRPSEKTQIPFTNHYFFPIVSINTIIIIQILLYAFFFLITYGMTSINLFSLILSVLIADVLYMVLDVLANRSFKNILKAGLKYLVISIFVSLISIPISLTKGFGFITYVPDNIEFVTVSFYDNLGLISETGKKDFYFYSQRFPIDYTFDQAEDIKVITDLHRLIVDNYRYFDYNEHNFQTNYLTIGQENNLNTFEELNYNGTTYINFDYQLTSGKAVSRQYQVNYNWLSGLFDLYQNDAFVRTRIPMAYFHNDIDRITDIMLVDSLLVSSKPISNEFNFDTFATYYLEDYYAQDKEQLLGIDYQYYGQITASVCRIGNEGFDYCTNDYLDLDSRFPKALAYLAATNNEILTPSMPSSMRVIYPDELVENDMFKIANYTYYYENTNETIYRYTDLTPDQILALTPYLVPKGVSTDQTLLITITNNYYGHTTYLLNPIYYQEAITLLKDNQMSYSNDIYQILYNEQLYKN